MVVGRIDPNRTDPVLLYQFEGTEETWMWYVVRHHRRKFRWNQVLQPRILLNVTTKYAYGLLVVLITIF
jgi:hypothetical protein